MVCATNIDEALERKKESWIGWIKKDQISMWLSNLENSGLNFFKLILILKFFLEY